MFTVVIASLVVHAAEHTWVDTDGSQRQVYAVGAVDVLADQSALRQHSRLVCGRVSLHIVCIGALNRSPGEPANNDCALHLCRKDIDPQGRRLRPVSRNAIRNLRMLIVFLLVRPTRLWSAD
jgi:hypothetical protein